MDDVGLLLEPNRHKLIAGILAGQQKRILIVEIVLATIDVDAELEVTHRSVSIGNIKVYYLLGELGWQLGGACLVERK